MSEKSLKIGGVIINCGTRLSTTLALMSCLRYCKGLSLTVINCRLHQDVENREYRYLQRLQSYCKQKQIGDFELREMPLRKHGETLDAIFKNSTMDYLLLVDSDLEVLDDKLWNEMCRWIQFEGCWGAGFVQGPHYGFGNKPYGVYAERMWMPFTLLKVSRVREAIVQGKQSFLAEWVFNDFPQNKRIGKYIDKLSHILNLEFLLKRNPLRKNYYGYKPNVVMEDTGSRVFSFLGRDGYNGLRTTSIWQLYVAHYNGCTRSVLTEDSTATIYENVEAEIEKRLLLEYNFSPKMVESF